MYLVACKYEEIQKIINVLSCLGNLIVARTMCLLYYCIAMEVIKGFPSLPVLDKQFLVMWFLVLVYLFFFVGLAYMQVFQVLPPLSYPENFPGYFTDVNRYLNYILFGDFSGHILYFKSVIFCNLSSLYRSCEVHCNSSSQIINVIWVWERHKITDTTNSNEPIKHLIGGEISST